MKKIGLIIYISLASWCSMFVAGQNLADTSIVDSTFESPDTLREGFVFIEEPKIETWDVSDYSFLHHTANVIQFNGADWSYLRHLYATTDKNNFSIVHIGDSHLQADITTGALRRMLQEEHGDGGRGLIIPFRLAGTNEPVDYRFTVNSKVKSSKLVKKPWITPMNFCGIGVTPVSNEFELTVDTEPHGESPFRFARIYHSGELKVTDVKLPDDSKIEYWIDKVPEDNYTDIFFARKLPAVKVSLKSSQDCALHGVMLSTEESGIIYHVIGNNGACYSLYNGVDGMSDGIATLYPDLIIVSLGTNDAFGRIEPGDFYKEVDRMVSDLRRSNPESVLLLTTPKECQKTIRRGKGRKAKKSYEVVSNCRKLRDVLLDYGRQNNVAVYDWFEVAGGDGASDIWVEKFLLGKDRVHNTAAGYELAAFMFHSALDRALSE